MLGEVPHFLLREEVLWAPDPCAPMLLLLPLSLQISGNGMEMNGLKSVEEWEEACVCVSTPVI